MTPNTETSAIASVLVALLVLLITLAVIMRSVLDTGRQLKKREHRYNREPDPRFGLAEELANARARVEYYRERAEAAAAQPALSARLPGVEIRSTPPPVPPKEPPKRQPVSTTILPRKLLPTGFHPDKNN